MLQRGRQNLAVSTATPLTTRPRRIDVVAAAAHADIANDTKRIYYNSTYLPLTWHRRAATRRLTQIGERDNSTTRHSHNDLVDDDDDDDTNTHKTKRAIYESHNKTITTDEVEPEPYGSHNK